MKISTLFRNISSFRKITSSVALRRSVSVLCALLLWQTVSVLWGVDFLLPTPEKVFLCLLRLCLQKEFYLTIFFSLLRIVAGFLLALGLGFGLALLAGRFSFVETFLWPYVLVMKSVPVASFIILSLIWLSAKQLTTFISFVMVFPLIYTNVLQGIKSADPKLLQMMQLFHVPYLRRLGYGYLLSIKPFLLSACSVALGMSWKAGVAAEVIGVVNGSIGERLYEAKIYLETGELFAWTLVILLVSLLFEKSFLYLLRLGFALWEKG